MIRIFVMILGLWMLSIIFGSFMVCSDNLFLQFTGTAIYFLAEPVCHQLPERSLFINSVPMPVCVRCFTIYLGGFFIFLSALIKKPGREWPKQVYLFAGVFVLLEILSEQLHFY